MRGDSDFAVRLGRLLATTAADAPFSDADLAEILETQLSQKAPGADRSIGDMLVDPGTVEDLVTMKEFAKQLAKQPSMPVDIPRFIYLAAIQRSRVKYQRKITTHGDVTVAKMVAEMAAFDWITGTTLTLLQGGTVVGNRRD